MEVSAVKNHPISDYSRSEKDFDDLAFLASHVSGASIAVIALIENGLVCFNSAYGIANPVRSDELAFCAHVVLGAENCNIPPPEFYVGIPLVGRTGVNLGTLCVMDRQPRELGEEQGIALEKLATQIVSQLETRKKHADLKRAVIQELIGELSHEINNPLAIIVGKAELLRKKSFSSEINREKLQSGLVKIEKAAFRIAQIVKALKTA